MSVIAAYALPHPPLILPVIGKGQEQKISKTINSYNEIAGRIADLKPELIVILSPHATMYADYFHISPGKEAKGDFRQFGFKELGTEVLYDEEFSRKLASNVAIAGIEAGTLGEKDAALDHATMIPLIFIQSVLPECKVVRIGLSGMSFLMHYRFGKVIAQTAEQMGRRTVIVASGDLSHVLKEDGPYGFAPEGPEFDQMITKDLKDAAFGNFFGYQAGMIEIAAECGMRAFVIMAGTLDGKKPKSELLSYEGPFGVGYGVAAFEELQVDEDRKFDVKYEELQAEKLAQIKAKEDPYVELARLSLETYVTTGKRLQKPDDLKKELLSSRAGVFVSLKVDGQLRGCIGTIAPTTASIADEIIQNAVSAGVEDPRFTKVRWEELSELVYSVDVLSPPEPIKSLEELDTENYGVIVTYGNKRGLLLPNLEGINTPEKQVEIAMQKGGIKKWEEYSLQRFCVVRHH